MKRQQQQNAKTKAKRRRFPLVHEENGKHDMSPTWECAPNRERRRERERVPPSGTLRVDPYTLAAVRAEQWSSIMTLETASKPKAIWGQHWPAMKASRSERDREREEGSMEEGSSRSRVTASVRLPFKYTSHFTVKCEGDQLDICPMYSADSLPLSRSLPFSLSLFLLALPLREF